MAAGEQNLIIDRGARWEMTVYLDQKNKEPIDLTGLEATFVIYPDWGGTAFLTLTSSPAAGITITEAEGKLEIVLTTAQTATMTLDSYVYHLHTIDGAEKSRYARGVLTIKP